MNEKFKNLVEIIQRSKVNCKFTILEIGALPIEDSKEPFYHLLKYFPSSEIIGFEIQKELCDKMNSKASKGIKYYEKGHYSYAYVILNKAYEIERDNHELVKFLVLLNIALEKDPVETRILMDTLQSKWSSLYTDKDIEDLRNLACSVKPYS